MLWIPLFVEATDDAFRSCLSPWCIALLVFVELFEHFAVNLFAGDECVHLEIVLKNADNRNNTLLIRHIPGILGNVYAKQIIFFVSLKFLAYNRKSH